MRYQAIASLSHYRIVTLSHPMLLRNSIDPASLENIGKGLYCLAMVFLAAILLSNWWLKRHPQHERFGMMMAKFQLAFGSIVNPIFSKSLQYLSLTFMTNLSRRAFYTGLSLIIVLMIVSTLFVTLKKTLEHFDRKSMLGREFFSNGSPNYRLSNDAYDAQRNPEAPTPELCIPTDIVESAYLPVFVKYPRSMDARLTKFCGNLNIADNSQLSKTAQRLITDSLNISCLCNFFSCALMTASIHLQTGFSQKKTVQKALSRILTREVFRQERICFR